MKNKIFTLFAISVFALVMIAGLASAAVDFLDENDLVIASISETVEQGNSVTVSFKAQEDGNGALTGITFNTPITMTYLTYTFDSANSVTGAITSLAQSATSDLMTLTFSVPEFQTAGTYDGTLTLSGTYTNGVSYDLPISLTVTEKERPEEVQECVVIGNNDGEDLKVEIKDISVISGFGDADEEFYAFDEIEVEVEIENDNNDDKMKEVTLSWGLYNSETGEWYVDDEENEFKLSEDTDKTMTFSFSLDEDIDELAEGEYTLYVWVSAVLDADEGEQELCLSASEELTIADENDFVIVNGIESMQTTACGTNLQIQAKVWNIGNEEQEEVFVVIESSELGISKKVIIGDIDEYDSEDLDVFVSIPSDAEEGTYELYFTVFDQYGEAYENDNDDNSRVSYTLTVEGNCLAEPKATVTASLESAEAKAGEELVIKAKVTNTGLSASTFEVSLDSYTSWATLVDVNSESVTLAAGESAEVLVTLKVNSGVSGNQDFNIVITEDGKALSQPVSVMIEKSGLTGITGNVIGEGNWPIWVIGAINVVLIAVIVLVAIKVARK